MMIRLTFTVLTILVSPILAAEPEHITFANGLNVYLDPSPMATQVAMIVVYDIGGDHDPKNKSGLAHLVEHMYVTSAAGKTAARTVEGYVQQYPMGWNAQTGSDYTVFAVVFDGARLDAELEDAAARMRDLRITQVEVDREKVRLLNEVGNMFDSVSILAAFNHARQFVRAAPSGQRHGGVPDQVKALTLAEVQNWWQDYYRPNNATMVISGKFDPAHARGLIDKHFKPLARGKKPPPAGQPGPAHLGQLNTMAVQAHMPGMPGQACKPPQHDLIIILLALRHTTSTIIPTFASWPFDEMDGNRKYFFRSG